MIVFQISFNQRGVDKYYFRGKFALQKGKCSVRWPGLNTLNGVLINILQVDKYRLAKKKNDFSTFVMSFFKRNKMFSERKKGYLSKSEKALEITIKPLLSVLKNCTSITFRQPLRRQQHLQIRFVLKLGLFVKFELFCLLWINFFCCCLNMHKYSSDSFFLSVIQPPTLNLTPVNNGMWFFVFCFWRLAGTVLPDIQQSTFRNDFET